MQSSRRSGPVRALESLDQRFPRWHQYALLGILAVAASALVLNAVGELELGTDNPRVRSATLFEPGPGPGPDILLKSTPRSEFDPGQSFGVRIKYADLTDTLSLTTVGTDVSITHVDQPATSQGYEGCCFNAPTAPGRYRLQIRARVAASEFLYEIPYTVRSP